MQQRETVPYITYEKKANTLFGSFAEQRTRRCSASTLVVAVNFKHIVISTVCIAHLVDVRVTDSLQDQLHDRRGWPGERQAFQNVQNASSKVQRRGQYLTLRSRDRTDAFALRAK